MRREPAVLDIDFNDVEWTGTTAEEEGGEGWDRARFLYGPAVWVLGTMHHLEGYAVETTRHGVQEAIDVDACVQERFSDLCRAFGQEDEPFQTITHDGTEYVVFLSPFSR